MKKFVVATMFSYRYIRVVATEFAGRVCTMASFVTQVSFDGLLIMVSQQDRQRLRRQAEREMRCPNARFDESDLVQEAMLARLERGLPPCPGGSQPAVARTMLRQKLTDLLRYHLRSQKRSIRREVRISRLHSPHSSATSHLPLKAQTPPADDPAEVTQRRDWLERLQESVSPADRQILRWRCIDQLTSGEIAVRLGVSTAAASKRYLRALAAVRAENERQQQHGSAEDLKR